MVRVHDKTFDLLLSEQTIQQRITEMGEEVALAYNGRTPLLLGVLNGSFVFAADLTRAIPGLVEVDFCKMVSYQGVDSGKHKQLIGFSQTLAGRDVLLIEDIVDTGKTMALLFEELAKLKVASVKIATLLFKPGVFQGVQRPDFVGFEIDDAFVVGYGLDYNGLGRSLSGIYQLVAEDEVKN